MECWRVGGADPLVRAGRPRPAAATISVSILQGASKPTRASAADQGVRPTICAESSPGSKLSGARNVEEAQDEEGGQQVDEPIHLAELAAQNLQQAVRREAKGQAVGDAEGQRDGHHGEEGRDGHFGIVPANSPHHRPHHAAHDNQRGGGGRRRDGAHHGRDEERQNEEQSGDDGGDAGTPAGRHPGRAFDVADHRRRAGPRAHDGGNGVGKQDAVEARDLTHLVEQVGLFAHGHQGADVVEEVDEEEDAYDLHEADAPGGGDIELAGGGGQVAQAVSLRRPSGDARDQAGGGSGEDADQHGGAHPPGQQGGDQQQSEQRQGGAPVGQVAQRDGGGGVRHDDARIAEADEGDEEAHAGGHGGVEFVRDGRQDQLAHTEQGEQQKRYAGEKDGAERGLPGHSHTFDHGIGEIGILPHAGRQRDGVAGESAHQEAARGGGNTGGGGHGGQRHARLVEDGGVDEDDVDRRLPLEPICEGSGTP